ncbi:MAG: pitrilysin family protein [Myxococcota bacterium]
MAKPHSHPTLVTQHILANGLTVVICPRPHLAQTYVSLFFGVGSRHEHPRNNGISHILEHMLFRGTRSYGDATLLNAAAEDIGGVLEGATYRDHMAFATSCHPSSVGIAISLLGELVQSPRYRGVEIERSILREELLETLDGDGRMIDLDNIAHRDIFRNHGLGLPIEGTLDNLEHIDLDELESHRQQYLVGHNGVVSIAGPVDPTRVLAQVKRAFGQLPAGSVPKTQPPGAPAAQPILKFIRDRSSQVDIRLSFRAVSMQHENYTALVTLGRLLADGLASRMHADLVDRRGLAYALHGGLSTYQDCGLFEFDVSVAPARAAEAVRALLDFVRASRRFRFTNTEFTRMRRRYRYAIEFMEDSAADLACWHGRAALFHAGMQMDALARKMNHVSHVDVRRAAKDVFKRQGLVLTAIGELARGEWRRVKQVVDDWEG